LIAICSDVIVLPVRMKRYAELSQQIHAIFQSFTPEIELISLDEAISWKRFHDEVFGNFIAGEYMGEYEKMIIDEFEMSLPEQPQWA